MAKNDLHRAELDKLRAELAAPGPAGGPRAREAKTHTPEAGPHRAAAEPNPIHDLAAMLHEVQDKLADAAEDMEDIVITHPLAAVAAAFLLGLVVGRIVGRTR